MGRGIITIGVFTFVEAVRSRLLWVMLALVIAGFALAEFLGSIAITEDRAIQVGVLSAVWRIVCVFLIGLAVISSLAREAADKGMDLLFSLPLHRAAYYFGKLGGFAAVAVIAAIVIAPLLLLYAPLSAVLLWMVSLFCELMLIICLSLFLVFTFNHVTVAVSGLMGIYVLARSIDSFQLMARGPFFDSSSLADQSIAWFLQALAYMLPSFSLFARADWLIDPATMSGALGAVVLQTVIYGVLISAAALFDLYRKSL
jgi:ABC-type transport system involved in multi-copper enzyme maturation permease subunit